MRTSSGKPSLELGEKPVILADAIALLSGVNFGSVEKVIAALELLSAHANAGAPLTAKLDDVPVARVVLGSRGDATRADNTRALCYRIAMGVHFD